MGWWSSIVSGASSVIGTVVNQAPNIAKVVSTVAGIVDAADYEQVIIEDGGDVLPSLYENLVKAEAQLLKAAQAEVQADSDDLVIVHDDDDDGDDGSDSGGDNVVSGPYNLTGLWTMPPDTSVLNAPTQASQDLSRFLSMNRVPLVFDGRDVGQLLQEVIFSKQHENVWEIDNQDITTIDFNLQSKKGEAITGKHCYYMIPFGPKGSNNAMHACTSIKYSAPKALAAVQGRKSRQMGLSLFNSMMDQISLPANTTTISAEWVSALGVKDLMVKAIQGFVADKAYELVGSPVDEGSKYTVQVKSSLSVPPAQVKSALLAAITTAMRMADTRAPPSRPPHKPAVLTPALPVLTVTNTSVMV